MNVVILAGGKGTRMAESFPDIPKPMITLGEKPILEYQIEQLAKQNYTEITLIVGYKAGMIESYFGDGKDYSVKINYIFEKEPLGTGGALALLPKKETLLIMGDLYFNIDFSRLIAYHKQKKSGITLFSHPNSHPFDSGVIQTQPNGCVTNWYFKKDARPENLRNLVNAGIYILSSKYLPNEPVVKRDLDKTIVYPAIMNGDVYAYRSSEYVKDMGTPKRLVETLHDIEEGVPKARNLSQKQSAVFLDRDGVLNEYKGFISSPDKIRLISGAGKALRQLNRSKYLSICVTNQPVVARGMVSYDELDEIHGRLDNQLAQDGAYLDDLFFCPHHPHKGYPKEVPELKIECECRKPHPGMLLAAASQYNINLGCSWMIGDSARDIEAGHAAGCKTIAVQTGQGGDVESWPISPDFIAADITAAVRIILEFDKNEETAECS